MSVLMRRWLAITHFSTAALAVCQVLETRLSVDHRELVKCKFECTHCYLLKRVFFPAVYELAWFTIRVNYPINTKIRNTTINV